MSYKKVGDIFLMAMFEDKQFKIIRSRGGFILIRKTLSYDHHSHFRDLQGCRIVMKLFYRKLIPYKNYFKTSMKRITADEEFAKFGIQKPKQKYKNKRQELFNYDFAELNEKRNVQEEIRSIEE